MDMITAIAWKNIWRNKLRSTVVMLAIGFGLLSGIFSVAFMNGALVDRIDNVINNEISSLQLHNVKYLDNNEINFTIDKVDEKLEYISSLDDVEAVSKRYKMEVMLAVAGSARGTMVNGIIPEQERNISDIHKLLVDSNSTYFESVSRNPILIGASMAEKLGVKVRSKIILSAVNTEGQIINQSFRVCGIYKTGNNMFDNANVYVKYSDLAKAFSLDDNSAHEIAVMTKDILETDSVLNNLKSKYTNYSLNERAINRAKNDSLPDNLLSELKSLRNDKVYNKEEYLSFLKSKLDKEYFDDYKTNILSASEAGIKVMDWSMLSPELKLLTTWMDFMLLIYVGIILFALGFGIINTMLMVVLERVKELGMLMAIGMNKLKVFLMIMWETVLLSLTGGVLGIILSLLALWPFKERGIDLSSMKEGFEAMGFSTKIYPTIDFGDFVQVVILVILVGILSSIYPAIRAIKLKPAEAVRTEI